MNTAAKILVSGVAFTVAACGMSTPSDVATAPHDRAAAIARTRRNTVPTPVAANRNLAEAQADASAKIADAHAAAHREIKRAAVKLSQEHAKVNYSGAIAKADGDLSIAVEKCRGQPAETQTGCENSARSMRDQSVETAKVNLSVADWQAD